MEPDVLSEGNNLQVPEFKEALNLGIPIFQPPSYYWHKLCNSRFIGHLAAPAHVMNWAANREETRELLRGVRVGDAGFFRGWRALSYRIRSKFRCDQTEWSVPLEQLNSLLAEQPGFSLPITFKSVGKLLH